MEKNNKIGQKSIEIIEEALEKIKKAVQDNEKEQITLQDILNRIKNLEEDMEKIKTAII